MRPCVATSWEKPHAHNLKVVGSNPAPATNFVQELEGNA
jgi:hypothetical protein